jgi:hypothetical protein
MELRHTHKRALYVAVLAFVSLLISTATARADTGTFTNSTSIAVNGYALAPQLGVTVPYPSTIAASGLSGTITKVTVTLSGVNKLLSLRDSDYLLVDPSNKAVLILSDGGVGGTSGAVNLTFDDAAPGPLPLLANPVLAGTYTPTNYSPTDGGFVACDSVAYDEPNPDAFHAPAPAPPYGSALSFFNGDDPNGTWSLYAVLDCLGTVPGVIGGGWSITITTGPTAAQMTSFSAARAKTGVTVRWRTASEVDVLGFNVYRRTSSGPLRKVNRSLIAAKGAATGASYRFVDRSARPGVGYSYRLQLVDVDGKRTWYGSARMRGKGS